MHVRRTHCWPCKSALLSVASPAAVRHRGGGVRSRYTDLGRSLSASIPGLWTFNVGRANSLSIMPVWCSGWRTCHLKFDFLAAWEREVDGLAGRVPS